jgi:hypothetical protein
VKLKLAKSGFMKMLTQNRMVSTTLKLPLPKTTAAHAARSETIEEARQNLPFDLATFRFPSREVSSRWSSSCVVFVL